MGREAECLCRYGGSNGTVKALLESKELILRGAVRKHIPIAEILAPVVHEDQLRFSYAGEAVSLQLGNAVAEKWLAALHKPPATLAKKLGITAETRIFLLGESKDPALAEALREAAAVSASDGDLILAIVDSTERLNSILQQAADQRKRGVPIWVIYPKGSRSAMGETDVRSMLRSHGLMDTKVASVSTTLTALRFNTVTTSRT